MKTNYIKPDKKDCVSTTVSIEKTQKKWIKENRFNLSDFVRDCLNDLMLKTKGKSDNGK